MVALPTENQVNSALRHVGTATGTTVGLFVVLGQLSPEQASSIIAAMHQVTDGLQQAFGGISKISLIIGPLFAAWMALMAGKSAGVKSQLANILKIATSSGAGADQAQAGVVAASTMVLQSSPSIAPSQEVKVAILDAAAALPETKGQIKVSDPALVKATLSDKVVAA
jgi:hypothetical protein